MVELYEKGYGKDAANIAMSAISYGMSSSFFSFGCTFVGVVISRNILLCFFFSARNQRYDVVLVDTAGRMQDNEPLMRALAKVSGFHHQKL